jgi:baseplate J-like protein
MAEIRRSLGRPSIDYTARDYDSILAAMRALVPERLPQWTDHTSEADVGTVLLELFAHMGDVIAYYQDRVANEAFLGTARTRRSVIDHLRLIGYELGTAAPASAKLEVTVPADAEAVTVKRGDAFATRSERDAPSIRFEYNGAADQTLAGAGPFELPVEEGRLVKDELVGKSDLTPNQRHRLAHAPLILRSRAPGPNADRELAVVTLLDGETEMWTRRETLAFSHAARRPDGTVAPARDYVVEIDEDDQATIVFGDGILGAIPKRDAEIRATYRVGGGTAGNVPAGAIDTVLTGELARIGASVTNRERATGGADRESIERAVKHAPAVFRSTRRAVTAADYEALALEHRGVGKVRASASNWNTVTLYVAPDGGGSVSDVLEADLRAHFEDKRPLSTLVEVEDALYRQVAVAVDVGVLPYYSRTETESRVLAAAGALLAFESVDFGRPLYLSKVYEVIEAIEAVESVNVTEFRRTDRPPDPKNPKVLVAPSGVLEFGEHEIPEPLEAKEFKGGIRANVTGGF